MHRDGGSGWAGWAYAHPDFGSLEGAAGQWRRTALLLAHSDFQTLRHPCPRVYSFKNPLKFFLKFIEVIHMLYELPY